MHTNIIILLATAHTAGLCYLYASDLADNRPTTKMSLQQYNNIQQSILEGIYDTIKWHLGVELGRDPYLSTDDTLEVEMRMATWLLDGGGAWLRTLPQVQQHLPGTVTDTIDYSNHK